MNASLRLFAGLFALVLALAAGPRAEAAPVNLGYHVTATTAQADAGGIAAPFLPFTLDFSLAFDDSVSFFDRTNGIVFDLHGYPLGAAFAVTFTGGNLVVGGTPSTSAVGGNNDFLLVIANPADPDAASIIGLYFTLAAFPESLWQSTAAILTVTDLSAPAGVPAPAALSLLGLGLAGLAVARRRRA